MCSSSIVIAIGGPPGSGKTTVAKLLAQKLSIRHVSIGQIFRNLAEERGLTLAQLTELAEKDSSIDFMLDSLAKKEAEKGNVVIDGHAAPWLLKGLATLRVAVVANFNTRVKRLAERDGKPVDQVMKETLFREEVERRRYLKWYNIDIRDFSDFDIVINSERFAPNEIVEIVLKALEVVCKRPS
uniref:Cytidylate kinase n=1 Tax=Ignisphaera aggregans TaxID=334771 RepID=A0A7C4FFL7_9CREN